MAANQNEPTHVKRVLIQVCHTRSRTRPKTKALAKKIKIVVTHPVIFEFEGSAAIACLKM
jgi:hypothetical protein